MKFEELPLKGAFVVSLEPRSDERGSFARTFCVDEFSRMGLEAEFPQHSLSVNLKSGTFRGMHFQKDPRAEVKLVRCLRGRAWDILLDLRKGSPTFKQWQTVELSAENRRAVYIPKGFAHGFLTLEDNTELSYLISERYHPDLAAGVRWNDPSFSIRLPENPKVISPKDLEYPDYE
ncbi:MAG: dTDP-4-dehydrorhamnose 3,5-epimerase [Bdellovibrio sp.]